MAKVNLELEQLLMTLLRSGLLVPGSVATMHVRHDEDCAIWSGHGCNCEAEVELETLEPIEGSNGKLN